MDALQEILLTWQNVAIMVACGVLTAAFKHGPLTQRVAATKWGKAGIYYLPFVWCWLALFIPWQLAPADAGVGARFMLGAILGGMTSKFYDLFMKTYKHLSTKKSDDLLLKS